MDNLNAQEVGTVLAALRLWQSTKRRPEALELIATDDDSFPPLADDEIDALCEKINVLL